MREAKRSGNAQFHSLDLLRGKRKPEIGGKPEYLDIIGLNYYFNNQWRNGSGRRVLRGHPEYRPFHSILQEYHQRYRRPVGRSRGCLGDHQPSRPRRRAAGGG